MQYPVGVNSSTRNFGFVEMNVARHNHPNFAFPFQLVVPHVSLLPNLHRARRAYRPAVALSVVLAQSVEQLVALANVLAMAVRHRRLAAVAAEAATARVL